MVPVGTKSSKFFFNYLISVYFSKKQAENEVVAIETIDFY